MAGVPTSFIAKVNDCEPLRKTRAGELKLPFTVTVVHTGSQLSMTLNTLIIGCVAIGPGAAELAEQLTSGLNVYIEGTAEHSKQGERCSVVVRVLRCEPMFSREKHVKEYAGIPA